MREETKTGIGNKNKGGNAKRDLVSRTGQFSVKKGTNDFGRKVTIGFGIDRSRRREFPPPSPPTGAVTTGSRRRPGGQEKPHPVRTGDEAFGDRYDCGLFPRGPGTKRTGFPDPSGTASP